jgi:hypothetical protein
VTAQPEEESVPVHEGPDAKDWPDAAPKMWGMVLNIEFLNRIIEALDGPVAPEDGRVHGEAHEFLVQARKAERGALAETILHAYGVELLEENPGLPTEAVGGSRGDGDSPGNRDHVRGVRQ